MFGPDGKFIKLFGRLGSGPGEFRDAEGITIARDGRIWVRDGANTRFSVFNAEGVYEKAWTMKFCWFQGQWYPQVDRQNRIIYDDCGSKGPPGRSVLAYHTDMSRVETLADMPACGVGDPNRTGTFITRPARGGTMYQPVPWWPAPLSAVGPDGEVWCAPNSGRYELIQYRVAGTDSVRVSRAVSPVPVTAAERDSQIAYFEKDGPTGLEYGRIPKSKPAIDRITVDEQGRLWVRRPSATGVIEFDIYSSNGRILATIEWGKYRNPTWVPFVVRGDNLYTVVLDDDGLQHVVRFKIGR
jgi:hypothetical protein